MCIKPRVVCSTQILNTGRDLRHYRLIFFQNYYYVLVPQCMHYSSSAILLYRHCSRFIIHTRVIIFRVYTYYIHCYKCVCRLRVYYNLIYIFNVFIARRVEGEIIITIMTADYCAWRGSLSKYKLTLLNRVFSAFW